MVNEEQDTVTDTESEDNPVSTNGEENITLLTLSSIIIIKHGLLDPQYTLMH